MANTRSLGIPKSQRQRTLIKSSQVPNSTRSGSRIKRNILERAFINNAAKLDDVKWWRKYRTPSHKLPWYSRLFEFLFGWLYR